MIDRQTITIQSQLDIIEARMRVRSLARESGLDLFDQARISLATSTLAIILGLETAGSGEVSMIRLSDGDRVGVEVVCIKHHASTQDLAAGVLDDARRMVDGLRVQEQPGGHLHVTLVKWASRGKQQAFLEGSSSLAFSIR